MVFNCMWPITYLAINRLKLDLLVIQKILNSPNKFVFVLHNRKLSKQNKKNDILFIYAYIIDNSK